MTSPSDPGAFDDAVDARLRAFAQEDGAVAPAAVWARIAQDLPQRPQHQVLLRRITATPMRQRPARRVAAMAAGVALAAIVSLSVLLTGGSTADASFLEAVRGLSVATDAALADGTISSEEAEGLAARVELVQSALASEDDLESVSLEEMAAALDALASVEARLLASNRPALSGAIQTLQTVQGQVQASIPAAPPGRSAETDETPGPPPTVVPGQSEDAPGRPATPGPPANDEGEDTPPGRPETPGRDDAGSRRPEN